MKGQRTRRREHVKSWVGDESVAESAPDLITAMSNEIEELREANEALASEIEVFVAKSFGAVTLREWDWDAQNFAEVEYPYSVIKRFVEWMRNTRQWKEDDTGQEVYRKFLHMQESLTDAKNKAALLKSAA